MTAPKATPPPAELIDLLDMADLDISVRQRAELLILVRHLWPTIEPSTAVRVVRYLAGGGWQ